MPATSHSPGLRTHADIFVVSLLILFLELVLIRWIGTELRIFAYLGNLLLVMCFFGAGLGCYRAQQPASLPRFAFHLAVLTALTAYPFHRPYLDLLAGFEDSPLWGMFIAPNAGIAVGLLVVAVYLYLVVNVFVPLGQRLGQSLGAHPHPIYAYSLNVAGGLAGVWLFNALSWCGTPPVVWFSTVALLVMILIGLHQWRHWGRLAILLSGSVGCVWLAQAGATGTLWSPYQKLEVINMNAFGTGEHKPTGLMVRANGTDYQFILNLSDAYTSSFPEFFKPEELALSHYNLAFQFKRDTHRLLIIGAGSGNNAAAALRHGVEQIDCVEIDPLIYTLGKQLHPEHPYDSPRVRMIVDDGRAFLKRSGATYDMIWFGLLDTHPGTSYNNRRLDHYVYTLESFREARRLLAPGGVLVVNFAARRQWIINRLQGMLTEVFGHEPLAYHMGQQGGVYGTSGELTLVIGNEPLTLENLPNQLTRDYVAAHQLPPPEKIRPTTDDWPYLYLERAKIPRLYLATMLVGLGTIILTGRGVLKSRAKLDWHCFFLGAAFLLLEVQMVSRATLLFGMTWVVNAIVISAVLLMTLVANIVTARCPRLPHWLPVTGLVVTLTALAWVSLNGFNQLAPGVKLITASGFLSAPVFFAGLIFTRSFATSEDRSLAFGSNLIGALVGGLLESVAFVTGLRALVVLVALFYLLALLCKNSPRRVHI